MGKGTDLFLRCCDLMGEIQNLKSGHYLQVDMRTKYVRCELNRMEILYPKTENVNAQMKLKPLWFGLFLILIET